MSYFAITKVTHMLRSLLKRQLSADFPSAVVTLLPPGNDLPKEPGANLYLYRVVESPFTKNQDWRGDRKPTPPSTRPALGLQLFYLITPLAPAPSDDIKAGDDAHLFLGLIMLGLQENPVLNDVHLPEIPENLPTPKIPAVDADLVLPEYIRNSYERLKITLLPTSVDEISRIWATINQPYRLS